MRELQSVLGALPAIIKALPVLAAYVVLAKFLLANLRGAGTAGGSDFAYTMIGLSALIWVVGR